MILRATRLLNASRVARSVIVYAFRSSATPSVAPMPCPDSMYQGAAGVTPAAPWYIESGQGMGATLGVADDRKAYTITDRATLLAFSKRVALRIMVEGDRPLLNLYSVME